ncbi:MAG: TIGR03435 family protein [Acidobacteriota bacterium]|nr:TIGR03435 family protein [Acidobacteriota bacterium]
MIGHSQEVPERLRFEVASIKSVEFPSDFYAAGFAAGAASRPCVLGKVAVSGTLTGLTRVGICDIIRIAYNVKSFQVFGVPSALGYSSHEKMEPVPTRFSGFPGKESSVPFYDIQARSPGTQPPSDEQVREMLRALLAERFSLKIHREQRPLALYALVPSADGPKLKPAATGCSPKRSSDLIQLCGYTMEQLAHFLNDRADRNVIDMTHISGRFDIEIPIDQEGYGYNFSALVASIRKNLGLRVEARRDQIEVLVVDHVEKPSAN